MKFLERTLSIAALTVVLPLASANAGIINFVAPLTGAAEVPPVVTPGSGFATITLDDIANTLTVNLNWQDLLGNVVAGHIHCCSLPTANAPVRVDFAGLSPTTSGTFWTVIALGPTLIGGLSRADFLAALNAGLAYVNLHTRTFPGGEVRGQLRIPEPASLAIFGLGLAVLGWLTRRRAGVS